MSRRKTTYCIVLLFLAVVVSLHLAVTVSSSPNDYAYFQISGRSMAPTFEEGDLVTVRTDVVASQLSAGSYPSGDIIVFQRPKNEEAAQDVPVMRRVVAIIDGGNGLLYFRTKGDGNPTEDNWTTDYRGEDYCWNGMISEKLLLGKAISSTKNFYSGTARVLGRYLLQRSRFSFVSNKTLQQLRSEGYDVQGNLDWLLQVNYTRSARYTVKGKIVALSWPTVTLQNTEGSYDLNVTARRINADGTIGDEVGSFSKPDQPTRLGLEYECHDPGFGVGFNPSAFVIGNRFSIQITGPDLECAVNKTETLTNTFWGQNETYVLQGFFANTSHSSNWNVWCDSESGLILKQTIKTTAPNYLAYEETETIETGVEGVGARKSPSLTVAAAVGVITTVITVVAPVVGSTSSSVASAISNLPLPNEIKSFIKSYAAKLIETVDKKKLEALKGEPFINKGELAAIGFSTLTMTLVFSFVEANGLPRFLDPSILATVVPSTFFSVTIVKIVSIFSEAFCARICGIYKRFSLWVTGFVTFLISGLFFMFPFSSPGITRYQSLDISKKIKAMMILSKTLLILTLTAPFAIFIMTGFTVIGDVGLLATLTTVCSSFIPVEPLAGKAVFAYKKVVSLAALVSLVVLLYGFTMHLIAPFAYIIVGFVSASLAAITLKFLRNETISGASFSILAKTKNPQNQ